MQTLPNIMRANTMHANKHSTFCTMAPQMPLLQTMTPPPQPKRAAQSKRRYLQVTHHATVRRHTAAALNCYYTRQLPHLFQRTARPQLPRSLAAAGPTARHAFSHTKCICKSPASHSSINTKAHSKYHPLTQQLLHLYQDTMSA
jgi:hypothetical protein